MTKCAKFLEGSSTGCILVRVAPRRPEHILESMWALSKWCLTCFWLPLVKYKVKFLIFQNWPTSHPKVAVPIPPFWGDFGVKMWPRKFCLGTRNAIFLSPKIGTFVKSAHFHAPKNGTLSKQMKNLRPLL